MYNNKNHKTFFLPLRIRKPCCGLGALNEYSEKGVKNE